MKYSIPEISWHNRDPVLSIDIQPRTSPNDPLRLATGGTDSHVLIWHLKVSESGSVDVDVAADLTRHQKAVNVVRWSPDGQFLASGDDESIIFIWKLNAEKEPASNMNMDQGDEQYKESWVIHKTLRGHVEDVLDISWSPDSLHLASGSVDNKLLIWDMTRGRSSAILTDHKGFVQGVAWDPKGQLIASTSSDRTFRTFDVTSKKVVSRSSKATLPFPPSHPLHSTRVRLYHDDTLQTFYRRLQFSPDGMLIAVPAGKIEAEQGKMEIKPINAVYIYTRYSLKVPACVLPCESPALACRWSPRAAAPRPAGPAPACLPLRARMLLAVATRAQVLLYDTQQKTPLAIVSNIHYTRLTDLSWSRCGRVLAASSTDGFVSMLTFTEEELGEEMAPELIKSTGGARAEGCGSYREVCRTGAFENIYYCIVSSSHALLESSIARAAADKKLEESQPMETDEAPVNETQSDIPEPEVKKPIEIKPKTPEPKKSAKNKMDSFIRFKSPGEKSPKNTKIVQKKAKTPVKIDVMEEVAMPSWSDNSSSEMMKPIKDTEAGIVIEDSEDFKLVYEETQQDKSQESQVTPDKKEAVKEVSIKSQSPVSSMKPDDEETGFFKQARVTDATEPAKAVPSPKAPRRVTFITISSPKTKKK